MPQITDEEFVERFRPETNPDGSLYRQRDWTDLQDWALCRTAHAERRLWTQTDGDAGEWCLHSGLHYVNRNYYVICEVPTPEGEEFWLLDDDMPHEEENEITDAAFTD